MDQSETMALRILNKFLTIYELETWKFQNDGVTNAAEIAYLKSDWGLKVSFSKQTNIV